MIGEREFRFVNDEELLDDDIYLLLPLLCGVTDDRVGMKLIGDLRVGDVLLEVLCLQSLLFLLEEVLLLCIEGEEGSFNRSCDLCCC